MESAAKGHTVMLRIALATILGALSAGAQIAVPATPSGGNSFLVPSVREWTYELQMHGPGGVHFDPYFVNSVLLETNLSHGARRDSGDGKAVKLTLRASPTGEKGERPLELDDAAKKAFFGPTITKASLVVVSSLDPLAENHPWKLKGRVFVSRRPRGNGRSIQRHTLESWVAEGVGLIKAQALNQAGAPIYSLQLVAYQ